MRWIPGRFSVGQKTRSNGKSPRRRKPSLSQRTQWFKTVHVGDVKMVGQQKQQRKNDLLDDIPIADLIYLGGTQILTIWTKMKILVIVLHIKKVSPRKNRSRLVPKYRPHGGRKITLNIALSNIAIWPANIHFHSTSWPPAALDDHHSNDENFTVVGKLRSVSAQS